MVKLIFFITFSNWRISNIQSFSKSVNYSNIVNWVFFHINFFFNFPNLKINKFPEF